MLSRILRKRIEKRSPIQGRLLYRAGQSLQNKQIDMLMEGFGWYMGVLGGAFGVALWELSMWAADSPRRPWFTLSLAVVTSAIIWFLSNRWLEKLARLRLGREGEELMGQLLVELRPHGYHAFHDLRGTDFNVDHVLVGPGGVFAIETKTISKPLRGAGEVIYDGKQITVGGFTPDRDPLVQAQASARHVRELIRRMTGREVPVKPVLVYPGWFVINRTRDGDVLVQNEKYLLKAIASMPRRLPEGDVNFLCSGVERHVIEQSSPPPAGQGKSS